MKKKLFAGFLVLGLVFTAVMAAFGACGASSTLYCCFTFLRKGMLNTAHHTTTIIIAIL